MRGKKPKERERYVLYSNGLLVEVTKEVYLEWYQSRPQREIPDRKAEKTWCMQSGGNRAACTGKNKHMG